jgi:hypothetical protein
MAVARPTLYDEDFYGWSRRTAQLVREGRWSEIDHDHVAEEISDLGISQERALMSQIVRVLKHLLKSKYQPEKHTRSWDLTIAEGRVRIAQIIRRNPSLEFQLDTLLADAYELARIRAAGETDLDIAMFPAKCPFTISEVRGSQP